MIDEGPIVESLNAHGPSESIPPAHSPMTRAQLSVIRIFGGALLGLAFLWLGGMGVGLWRNGLELEPPNFFSRANLATLVWDVVWMLAGGVIAYAGYRFLTLGRDDTRRALRLFGWMLTVIWCFMLAATLIRGYGYAWEDGSSRYHAAHLGGQLLVVAINATCLYNIVQFLRLKPGSLRGLRVVTGFICLCYFIGTPLLIYVGTGRLQGNDADLFPGVLLLLLSLVPLAAAHIIPSWLASKHRELLGDTPQREWNEENA